MEINIEIPGFLSNDKKVLKIRNFELSFIKNNVQKNISLVEMACHVKYISLKERNGNKIILERKDNHEKYQIKTNTTQDMDNLIATLNMEQDKYNLFIKEYYGDNNSYNLIEGDSFMDYFSKIKDFLLNVNKNLEDLKINPGLEKLLDYINNLLEKIEYYLGIINQNECKLKEQYEELYLESKEIKGLLINLREAVTSCTFGLHKNEVNDYIQNFKKIVKEKTQEINILIDEIKYNLVNYLALKIENDEEDNKELFTTKEEELTKILLENESLKIQNENLNNENQIISQFLIENKEKK
jgi:Cys-tRNA synthase (O-phospho-L-seryl-tRNA:Cys-tRNA synthase)